MATGKVVGQIEVTQGNIKVLGVDGVVREPGYEGYVYENEQVISSDPSALFQIKFLALPEASAYDGIFRILADGSVIHGRDAMDSMMSDENLVKVLEATAGKEVSPDDLETAAGEEGVEGSSSFTETDIVAESSVLGFSRGANGALGFGITDFGRLPNYDAAQITPPAITSPNVVIYDENGTEPVIQITATAEGAVTYGIGGLDSGFFDIDSATGLVTFKESPDFENPRDSGGDNEYNTYVTVTDSYGNYTTQLLSVSINNLNEAVTAFDDSVDAVEDSILYSTIELDANDTDLDGDNLTVRAGTYTTAQGGEIVIAADGSYTYTPALNFNGTDTVNYTVTDGEFTDVGTLTINVAPANDAPVAIDDAVSAVEDTVLNSAIDLDANDYDVDEDALSVVAGTFATANGGQLVLSSDGTYTYTPAANFNGVDSVNYTVTDGELTDVGTLTINVAAVDDTPPIVIPPVDVNDAPTVNVESFATFEEGSASEGDIAFTYTGSDLETPFGSLTFTLTNDSGGYLVIGTEATETELGTIILTAAGASAINAEVPISSLTAEVTVSDGALTATDTAFAFVGDNEVPSIVTDSGNPEIVSESGLSTGTDSEADTEFAYGTFTLSDPDGLGDIESITINDTTIAIGSLVGSNIDSDIGTLKVTGYDSETGEATYEYELTSPTSDGVGIEQDIFTLTAYDGRVNSAPANIVIDIVDDMPIISSTNAIGSLSDELYEGTLNMSSGADTPASTSISLTGITVGGLPASDLVFPTLSTDSTGAGSGSGSFKYSGDTYNFDFDLDTEGNYTVTLEKPYDTVVVDYTEFNSSLSGEKPDGTYNIAYTDVDSGEILTATVSPILNTNILLSSGIVATTVGVTVNGSGDGLGVGNNLLQSYFDNGDDRRDASDDIYTTESLIYKPDVDASSVTLFFTGGGNNAFNGNDVIDITINGTGYNETETISLNASDYPDGLDSYTVHLDDLPEGWSAIDSMQVTAGFDGTDTTSVKVSFGFSTTITADIDQEVIMDFNAVVTDVDGDSDTVDFMIVADKADIEEDGVITGTIGDDYIAGTDGDDDILGGDGDDYIDGGEGSDTIYAGGGDDTMVYDDSDVEIDGGEESDILVANSEIVDLSNVYNIEVIQLNSGATVIGNGEDNSINPADVISATDGGRLVIQSDDGDASTQAYADSTFGAAIMVIDPDGNSYAQYTDGDATLLIQIEDIIDPL